MNKKVIILSIILLGLVAIWGIYRIRSNNEVSSPALDAIPPDAFFILRSDNLLSITENILKENKVWLNLSIIPQMQELNDELAKFDSIVRNYSEFEDLIESRQIVLSGHMLSKVKASLLLSVGLKNRSERKEMEARIKELSGKNTYIQERNYDRATIYDVRNKIQPNETISFAFHKGIFLLSKSPILVEKAVRQLNLNEGLTQNPAFKHTLEIAGKNVKGNLFIRLSEFPQFLSAFAPLAERKLENMNRFGGWTELDLSALHDKDWLLSGFTQAADSSAHLLAILKKQSPVRPALIKILPKNTAFFEFLGISDIYQFRRDYNRYLRKIDKFELYKHEAKNIKKNYKLDLELDFEINLEDQLLVAYTATNNKIGHQNKFFAAKIRNRKAMSELLNRLAITSAEIDSVNPKQYIIRYKINENTTYRIWHFPVKDVIKKMYHLFLPSVNTSYCTILDDYLIMGNSPESLKEFINAYMQNRTFETNPEFKNFIESLSSRSNLLIYNEIKGSLNYWKRYFSNTMVKISNRYRLQLDRYQAFALQISNSSDILLTNVFLKLNPQGSIKPNVVWATHLDAMPSLKPQIVTNHYTHNHEVLIQDAHNKIYLINQYGKILWTKKLSEPILGQVVQVDYFKNGKLQYLFNTENYMHLIDRLGNYVESYPLKFKAPATNGISVFDYNKNKDYRIFVAAKNHQIYAYNIKGEIIRGWEFNLTDNIVHRPIQHFLDKGKDYIVFSDDLKTYITDRMGKIRVKPKANFPVSLHNIFYLDPATQTHASRLLTTSVSGTIMFIYLNNGKVTKLDMDNFSPSHYFDFIDVTGDGIKNFVYADENKLNVYALNLKALYSVKLDSKIAFPPHLYAFSKNDRRIGLTDKEANKIYLVWGKNGKIVKGFPQEGNTEFSITKFNPKQRKFNLIVGSKNNFLYNYFLNN